MQPTDITYSNERVLDFYREYIKKHGFAPLLGEAGDSLNLSKAAVHKHLAILKNAGYVGFRRGHRNVYLTKKKS